MNPDDRSKIEELKKSLYSRNAPEIRTKRRLRYSEEQSDVPTDWQHPEENKEAVVLNDRYENKNMSFTTKLFIGSLIFFACAMTLGAFLIFNGKNIISANNIDITINGPVTIAAGDPLNFDVQVLNKNNVTLQTVDLAIDYPVGTIDSADRSKELHQVRQLMDDIRPGGTGQKKYSAVLYGEENSKRQIKVNVSYKVANSNAVFQKTKIYDVLISSSPLSITVRSFKEVTSGQDFGVEVTLSSNSADVIKNLLLRAEFPFGFTLTSSDVKAEGNKSTWKIGDIPPKGKKSIKFVGNLEGQNGESRVFKFTAGAQSAQRPGTIGIEYIAAQQAIAIQKPFVSTSIAFDNDANSNDYVGAFGSSVKTTLSWFNNLPTAVTDGEIHIKLSGNAYDKYAVQPGGGYFQSGSNEIIWNKQTTGNLASMGAGESGNIIFNFIPHNFSTPSKIIINPYVTLEVSVTGKRLSEGNVPQTVTSSAKRTVKIPSNLILNSQVTRSVGPFENTGPVPPQADQQTTYTITWTVDNTVNTVSGATVKSLLPVYVKWLGKKDPAGEDIVYNANGEVVWRVGNIDTATTQNGHTRRVSFQVALQPSVSQIGQMPTLAQDTTLTGIDDFTGETLTATQGALSTRFADGFRDGQDVVVK